MTQKWPSLMGPNQNGGHVHSQPCFHVEIQEFTILLHVVKYP